jgi:hypothetical protein
MSKYTFRYFFDYGSGVCLWSANETTSRRFNYPVKITQLPVSDKLEKLTEQLIAQYDTSLDWTDPGGKSLWNERQWQQFDRAANELFELIQEELTNDFTIINEYEIS